VGDLRRSPSIAANGSSDDQLVTDATREQARRATMNGVCRVWATQSATGLRLDVVVGQEQVSPNVEPFISATGPLDPDHLLGEWPILAGELLSLPVRNTTGGAITLFYRTQVP
jgi:hypothetical protein